MRMRSFFVTTVLLLVILSNSYAQKMVGYIQSSTFATAPGAPGFLAMNQVQWQKMTDVVFCFLNPVQGTTTGALQLDVCTPSANPEYDFHMDKFMLVKSKCWPYLQNGPKLWIAVGGASSGIDGARPQNLNTACSSGSARTDLANSIINFAITHELYGIDIDWEFPNSPAEIANYSAFIIELRTRIDAIQSAKPVANRLKISVAVGGEYTSCGGHIAYFPTGATATNVINAVDYFHIMAYDLPGSYGSNHSSLAAGTNSMTSWNSCVGIPLTKMCLGIPFYGRPDPRTAATQNYNLMPAGSHLSDGPTGGYYYNGSPTINSKIDLMRTITNGPSVVGPAAGVVIWDVAQDKAVTESLLSIAYSKMYGTAAFATNPCPYPPYIGRDTTKCIGSTLTLSANWAFDGTTAMTTAGGTTFQWYSQNAAGTVTTIGSATNPTYTIPAAAMGGTQTFFVRVTKNTCVLVDSVVVSEEQPVSGLSATEPIVCNTGVAHPASTSLSGTVSSGSISWITASGVVAGTGNPASLSPTTTTTYYARGTATNPNKRYFAGRPAVKSNAISCELTRDGEAAPSRPEWVHRIVVYQPITLRRAVIYTGRGAQSNTNVVVMDATQPITNPYYATSTAVTYPSHLQEAIYAYPSMITNLNMTLQPGTYYVGIYNVNGNAACAGGQGAAVEAYDGSSTNPTTYPGVFTMDGNAWQYDEVSNSYVGSATYGQLYDWRLTSAPISQCTRPSIEITHDCTLPVQLIDFFGTSDESVNKIFWNTASEEDNSHFIIERSADMTSFLAIGSVEGHGTSNQINHYKFIDHNPLSGANYYRLAQHDIDGKINYSNIIMIENTQEVAYQVSPNPFTDQVTLVSNHSSEGSISVQVRNIQGAVVYEEQLAAGTQKFSVGNGLSSGVYFVQVSEGSNIYTYKVVKQ